MDSSLDETIKLSLNCLNPAQLKCVLHAPNVPLQILAGPGSGKTRVLTARIAYLILEHGIEPSAICAVTFTNKAAHEMKERLTKLIGSEITSKLRLGTFHALCALFLRRYANLVGLENNFTVTDADESKKMITTLLKPYKDILADTEVTLKEGTVLSLISREKARCRSPEELLQECRTKQPAVMAKASDLTFDSANDIQRIVAEIYRDYDKSLRSSNCLDFDDLLVYGVKLFKQHDGSVKWCKHILVDEFQDTNVTQYELMRALARHHCVSTVGDPDQSIYAWRSAEVANLARMQEDFPTTKQIFLEHNYRSTGSILNASLAIVSQDKTRIQKTLHSSHPVGVKPALISHGSEHDEATFIAQEIKRLIAQMGGVLNYGDFVVLLRFNALSRTVESALQRESIPSRVLAGHKFFERLEIKDLLAYLQLVDNPDYHPAFIRAVNIPTRGIGTKSISEINERARNSDVSPWVAVEKICDCKTPDTKPPVKGKLKRFVMVMRALRQMTVEGASPADILRRLLDLIGYEEHLRRTQADWQSRWENVQELITFASEVDISSMSEEVEVDAESTPLRLFLQASMLSSNEDNETEGSREKVTLSTCHAAKGLEWPVVMVPAVEDGTFPFYRTEDIEEERRLLYVACTRAQSLLYLSHVQVRKVAGETKNKELSLFVGDVQKQDKSLFGHVPHLTPNARREIALVLGRKEPEEDEVDRRIKELQRTSRSYQTHLPSLYTRQEPSISTSMAIATPSFSRPVMDASGKGKGKKGLVAKKPFSTIGKNPTTFGTQRVPAPPTSSHDHTLDPSSNITATSSLLPTPVNGGTKRRLGMGAGGTGYSGANKKFRLSSCGK